MTISKGGHQEDNSPQKENTAKLKVHEEKQEHLKKPQFKRRWYLLFTAVAFILGSIFFYEDVLGLIDRLTKNNKSSFDVKKITELHIRFRYDGGASSNSIFRSDSILVGFRGKERVFVESDITRLIMESAFEKDQLTIDIYRGNEFLRTSKILLEEDNCEVYNSESHICHYVPPIWPSGRVAVMKGHLNLGWDLT